MSISNLVCVVLGGVLVAVFFLIRQTYRDRQKSSQSSQPGEKALQAQLNLMKSDLSDARNAVSRQALMAQRMALVAHVTAHAVLVTDASGLIEWVNDGFTRITGIKPEEALGRTPGALLQGAGTDQTTVATMRQAITEGAGFRVQVLNYTRLKIPIWVDVEAMPVYDDTGKVISFVAIQSDITVIKQAQSDLIRMRDLMNEIQTAASIGGWEHDCSTNLPFWTNETFRIFGLDAASGVPPIDVVFDFFIPDSREKIISAVADASGKGTPWNLELQVITLDKRRLWVRSIGQARHRQGIVTHLFGSFQDITSEHVIRHELTQAATKARAADHAKSSFLAMVSHEIRTPMNGVIGMSELLGMTQLTEDQRVYLSTIVTSGELLLTIIDDILDFSRIEAGKLSIIPTSVDLHDLVANVLRLLQPAASDKRIYLVGLINPRVPHKVEIDGGRLR